MGRVVEDLRRQQPDPFHHPLDVAVDRDERQAEAEQQHDRRGLLADAVDPGQPVARLERGHVAEELERVVAALLADLAERRLDPRRLLGGEPGRTDDVHQLLDRGELDARPVRRRAVRQAAAAPALARVVMLRRKPRRVERAEPLERDLGVRVGGVLGEDREDQLARRVEAAVPLRVAVDAGELVEGEVDEARPVAIEAPLPGDDRIRLRVASVGLGFAAGRRRAGVFSSVIARP